MAKAEEKAEAQDPAAYQSAPQATGEPVRYEKLSGHDEILKELSFLWVSGIAGEMGFVVSILVPESGSPFVVLSDENGAQMIARPVMCTGDGFESTCKALLMMVVFSGFPNSTLPAVNGFNDAQFFARGHLSGDGRAVLSRLVVADHGAIKGNLGLELYSFRSAAYNFARFLTAAPATGPTLSQSGSSLGSAGMKGLLGGSLAAPQDAARPAVLEKDGLADTIDTLRALHMLDRLANGPEVFQSEPAGEDAP